MLYVEIIYIGLHSDPLHLALSLDQALNPRVLDAILESKLLSIVPELNDCLHDLSRLSNRVGIFGKLVTLETLLENGDRIEIYRPLIKDPKVARRERANPRKYKKQRN